MESIRELESNGFIDVEEKVRNANQIMIFGAGITGRNLKVYLESHMGVKIDFFIDNDPSKYNTFVDNVPVISPIYLLSIYHKLSNPLICFGSDSAKEMAYQLREMGIKSYIDLTCWSRQRCYLNHKELKKHLLDFEKVSNLLEDKQSKDIFLSILRYRMSLDPTYLKISDYDQYCHPSINFAQCRVLFDVGAWLVL